MNVVGFVYSVCTQLQGLISWAINVILAWVCVFREGDGWGLWRAPLPSAQACCCLTDQQKPFGPIYTEPLGWFSCIKKPLSKGNHSSPRLADAEEILVVLGFHTINSRESFMLQSFILFFPLPALNLNKGREETYSNLIIRLTIYSSHALCFFFSSGVVKSWGQSSHPLKSFSSASPELWFVCKPVKVY